MQAGEEGLVLERFRDEGVDILLEGQFDADADRAAGGLGVGAVDAFVGGLHEARAPAAHDVAVEPRELGRDVANGLVDPMRFGNARRAEDGGAIAFAFRRPQPGQVVHRFPQVVNGRLNDIDNLSLVAQTDRLG
jgi:hypothetical protein